MIELLIVGAGPAGMSAAIEAARHGKRPVVVDNRPEPGGNIYAYLGSNRTHRAGRMTIFGSDYAKGAKVLDAFLNAVDDGRIVYHPSTRLWHVDSDGGFAFEGPEGSQAGQANRILLATGAQERPMPLPGWTLPGVMGVGAAQILMKSGGDLPAGDIIVVGAGPLPLLLAEQLAVAKRPIRAMVEPAGGSALIASAPSILGAIAAPKTSIKGAVLLAKRFLRRTPVWSNAAEIRILGVERATGVRFRSGREVTLDATTVLIHDGIVPNLNPIRAAGLDLEFSEQQQTWHAIGNNVVEVAGDGAGILGVDAAIISGRAAARKICEVAASKNDEHAFRRQKAFRRFIDKAYPPVRTARTATPDTVLCRCEMIRAETVEGAIETHGSDPNAIKRALRLGMGPCQGRMCSHSLADFVALKAESTPKQVGLPRARNPIVPVSFSILADLKE